jgi:hypothetical protein
MIPFSTGRDVIWRMGHTFAGGLVIALMLFGLVASQTADTAKSDEAISQEGSQGLD